MKSSDCNFGDCVEVTPGPDGGVYLSDSKTPGLQLWLTREEWVTFVAGVKAGEFDLPEEAPLGFAQPLRFGDGCTWNRQTEYKASGQSDSTFDPPLTVEAGEMIWYTADFTRLRVYAADGTLKTAWRRRKDNVWTVERAYHEDPAPVKGEFPAHPEGSSTGGLSSPSQAVQSAESNDHLA